MKTILTTLLIFLTINMYAKHDVKVYYERNDNGYTIYADNNEYCPVTIQLEFTVTNLSLKDPNNNLYVIQPRQKKQLVTQLTVTQKNKGYKLSYTSWTNYGDATKNTYDHDYAYDLPYAKGQSFKVHQGYNGTFSHYNKNALDFDMSIGSAIHAVRNGVVIKIVTQHHQNCGTKECKKYNNHIIIYHSDGTFAEYTHLKQNGVTVALGDIIKQGQLIGYSGNTGWSTGPHLHLEVFLQKMRKRETIQTKFKINDNTETVFLKEKNSYKK
ncbi:M23 family metallopeptidase [Dokdonia pacifica]|uniref:Murein DD-endopeptidase MepM and murein hydrolase activator NlpD, contain LysM domain n=1 Tax=Dokdonia pacifica TaxID=1627892 RepID=A0A238YXM1_9FLAO|nr:M23 family metallopeptidase [Dokdonia pacifica]SNR75384.1 Murein DD-endopeptidase MepM and murein hydrolase activator NlpD, contain LysM domain [Dokdonia pacifica]